MIKLVNILLSFTKKGRKLKKVIKEGKEAFDSVNKLYNKIEKYSKNQALKKDIKKSSKEVKDLLNAIKDLNIGK